MLLKEDPMGFVHDLAKSTQTRGNRTPQHFGADFFSGKEGGRAIKQAFNKNADHQWLSTLNTVHWGNDPRNFSMLVGRSKDELSAIMYEPSEYFYSPLDAYDAGLWIKGRITLATNNQDELYSGRYFDYMGSKDEKEAAEQEHRKKSSGVNKLPTVSKDYSRYGMLKKGNEYHEKMARNIPYVLDQSTWDPKPGVPNEALVDNWEAVGLVVGDDSVVADIKADPNLDQTGWRLDVVGVARSLGIPLYDLNKEIIWEDK